MTRRVWFGLEGSYAAGRLIGRWVDASDCDEAGIAALLAELQTEDPEGGDELSIMDTEGWGLADPSAMAMVDLALLDSILSERPECEALIGAHGTNYYRTPSDLESGLDGVSIYGPYDSLEDYADQLLADGVFEVPDSVRPWLDLEAMGRDVAMDASEVRTEDGIWLVFE